MSDHTAPEAAPQPGTAFTEQALVFDCEGDALVGVLARPAAPPALGVVIVVGGPQVRAGAHRMFVQIARAWAGAGVAVLRFDLRGMGDSGGDPRGFLHVDADIAAAVRTLRAQVPGLPRVALCGLCDGASAAVLHADAHPGIDALCLLNPWVHAPATSARARVRHHYLRQLGQRQFWARLLRGALGWRAAAGLWRQLRGAAAAAPTDGWQARVLTVLARHPGPVLVALCAEDHTAAEFEQAAGGRSDWRAALAAGRVQVARLAGADHTFSRPGTLAVLGSVLQQWARESATPTPPR